MAFAAAHGGALQSLEPVDRAIAVLSPLLNKRQFATVVWRRVLGREDRAGLPGMGRDEHPADIFVAVAHCGKRQELAEGLRETCGRLLKKVTHPKTLADVLGEKALTLGILRRPTGWPGKETGQST